MDESIPKLDCLRLERNAHRRTFLIVSHPLVSARIALQGAHIVSCVPTGQPDLLWMSPTDDGRPGIPLRGGIPICWPWFGGQRPGPSHGIARTSDWLVNSAVDTGDCVRISLELPAAGIKQQLRAEDWRVIVEFELGSSLSVSLSTTNTGTTQQPLSQALHSYLPVQDIRDTRLLGLEDVEYLDQLTGVDRCRQPGPVTFSSEVDRIYHGYDGPIRVDDASAHYLLVSREGSESAVIWNPWIEKSKRLGQFPVDGYKNMVCVEAANAGPDTRLLAPGETHSLRTRIQRV